VKKGKRKYLKGYNLKPVALFEIAIYLHGYNRYVILNVH